MTSGKVIVSVATILSGVVLIFGIIDPKMLTLEAVTLSVIAAYLGGIYTEIKRANDLRTKQ